MSADGNPDFVPLSLSHLQQGVVRARPRHRRVERVGGVAGLAAVPASVASQGRSGVPFPCNVVCQHQSIGYEKSHGHGMYSDVQRNVVKGCVI